MEVKCVELFNQKELCVVQKASDIFIDEKFVFSDGTIIFMGDIKKLEKALKVKAFEKWKQSVLDKIKKEPETGVIVVFDHSVRELQHFISDITQKYSNVVFVDNLQKIKYTNVGPCTFLI